MKIHEKLIEHFLSEGGIVDFEHDDEVNFDFEVDLPSIKEISKSYNLEIDCDGDGLISDGYKDGLVAYWVPLVKSISVYKR